jgi:hypothetical protein
MELHSLVLKIQHSAGRISGTASLLAFILCLSEDGGAKDLYQEDKQAICLIRTQCTEEDCKITGSVGCVYTEINILTIDIRFQTKDLLQ